MHEKPGPEFNEAVLRGRRARSHERTIQFDETTVRTADDLGALVRHRRKAQGMTQEQLAELANSHRNRIAELERGVSTERVTLLLRALNELGLELVARSRNVHRGQR